MNQKEKLIANNKKAKHDYFIEEVIEAGIVLSGTEVKSIRGGKVSLKESFCQFSKGELILQGMHISPYEQGNIYNQDPLRSRKLLLHRRELDKLYGQVKEKGISLVPLSLSIRHGLVKVDIAVAKGKKLYDKRETHAKRDAQRKIDQALKERMK